MEPLDRVNAYYKASADRMETIFKQLISRTSPPAQAASQLFTWLDRIVSGSEQPFDIFGYPLQPGETPRMEQFTSHFTILLISFAQSNGPEHHNDLIAFTQEFYRLLRGRPWVCRGETMEKPKLGMLSSLGNTHPYSMGDEREEATGKMVINRNRFLALLENRLQFGWLRETLVREIQWAMDARYTFDVPRALALAWIIDIAGEDLYRAGENYKVIIPGPNWGPTPVWGVYRDVQGLCKGNWEGWIGLLRGVQGDSTRREEVRNAARGTVLKMVEIAARNHY